MYIDNSVASRPYEAIVAALNAPAVFLGPSGRVQCANALFAKGTGRDLTQLYGQHFGGLLSTDDARQFDRFVQFFKADQKNNDAPQDQPGADDTSDSAGPALTCAIATGSTELRMSVTPVLAKGQTLGFLCQPAPDETPLQLAQKLRLAVDASAIGIWEFDPNIGSVHWDDRMLDMYGVADGQNDRPADSWQKHLHPEDAEATLAYADHCQANGLDFRRDYRILRPDGEVRYIRSRACQVQGPNGAPRLIGANIDITDDMRRTEELEQAKAQLRHDSRHDALTGLGNRRLLDETVATSRDTTDPYAVLHLDLDYFKTVNDTFGHAAGDAVLVEVANRLRAVVQAGGLICRTGGDEFAIYLQTAPDKAALGQLCDEIVSAMAQPIPYNGHLCQIGVSIGCAIGKGWFACHSDIFLRADAALYAAKNAGRNCYRIDRLPT